MDREELKGTILLIGTILILLLIFDPGILSDPTRLFRWLGGGSYGN